MIGRYLIAAAAFFVLGFGQAGAMTPPSIVSATDLPDLIARENPVILSAQSQANEKGNEPGYLKGAYAVDEDLWTSDSRSQAHLDDLALWSRLIGELGIGSRQRLVIVYDNGALKFASRVRYLLHHYGIDRAVLVNGGWPAIEQQIKDGKLEGQPHRSVPFPQSYTAVIVQPPIPVVTRAEVLANYKNPMFQIVDVRTPGEYTGKDNNPPVPRPGHIPNAINVPLQNLLDASGNVPPNPQLRAAFLRYGVDPRKRLMFYCYDGARSSLVATMAVKAGFSAVNLYYLSFLDWSSNPNDPVVTGPNPATAR